jgi:hypothetical protein
MCGKTILFKTCLAHCHTYGMLDGAVVHSFSWGLSFKEKDFWFVYPVVSFKQRENGSWKDGKPIPTTFSRYYLELHVCPRNMFHLQEPKFAQPNPCSIEQSNDGFMLDIGSRLDYMADLILSKNLWQPEVFARIECMWHYIRRGKNVFKKEATALSRHSTFIPTYTMLFFDVIDVRSNVILGELLRIEVIEIGKNIAHLSHIVADGHWGVGFGF